MKRELTRHRLNGLNEALKIAVLDDPGAGNACHRYAIRPVELDTFPADSDPKRAIRLMYACCDIYFQNGPIQEAGVNGVSQEALLAVVEDRLASFQAGPYACEENEQALLCVREALTWLYKRTRDRTTRGVEGTSEK